MIDGVIRSAVDESIRFLQPGAVYCVAVNDHDMMIVRIESPPSRPEYLVACRDCGKLIGSPISARRVYFEIHGHTEPEPEADR